MKVLLNIFFVVTLSSCEKKDINAKSPTATDTSEIVQLMWETPLKANAQESWSIQPILHRDNVYFSSGELPSGTAISSFDKLNGRKNWSTPVCNGPSTRVVFDNWMALDCGKYISVLNLDSENLIWSCSYDGSMPRITEINGNIYHKHGPSGIRRGQIHLVRSPIEYEKWDTIYTINKKDGYVPSIEGPSLWINSTGDSVLIFQNRSYNFDLPGGRIDLYGYNLKYDSVQFQINDVGPYGNSNVMPPLIDGDRAYFLTQWSVICLDLPNGKILWEQEFIEQGGHLILSNLLVIDEKLIINQDHEKIRALNKFTGNPIWTQTSGGPSPSYMTHYNGIIYYTADGWGKLMGVDSRNGKIVLNEDSPRDYYGSSFPNAAFNGGVAIDSDSNYLYVADYYFAYCYKLPEEY